MKSIAHYISAIQMHSMRFINERKGWTTNRKIVVIESDDWGSIRIPSLGTLKKLLEKGINFNSDFGCDKYDTLASNQDIEYLMDILLSVKDHHGNPAKMTLNYLMANPDFKKIKETDFKKYYYEVFTQTLKRYPNHDNTFNLVKEGIGDKVFMPQFHGREHLNVQMWLDALRKNYPGVRDAFDAEIFCNQIDKKLDKRFHFLDAYNIVNKKEYVFVQESIKEGLELFEKIFGFKSLSLIAPNYTWDVEIEKIASDEGVRILQGGNFQKFSEYEKKHIKKNGVFHYFGEANKYKQIYLLRNCLFEPSYNSSYDYSRCLKDIHSAFNLKKPAIITAHRLNFIGELYKENRNNNLKQLRKLLSEIEKLWPDIEFMSSDELGMLISNS